jgi:outer membrane beta-barrel protein
VHGRGQGGLLLRFKSIWVLLCLVVGSSVSYAEEVRRAPPPVAAPASAPAIVVPGLPAPGTTSATKLDMETVKRMGVNPNYDRGDLRVVQNKLYPKARTVDVSLLGTALSTDPFLSVKSVTGVLGFNFNEFIQIHAMARKDFVSPSAALEAFNQQNGTTNSNPTKSFIGGGLEYTPIYGKISVFGSLIAHYDFSFQAGAGVTQTDNGGYVTPYAGFSHVYHLNQWLGFKLDYKFLIYRESIINKVDAGRVGEFLFYHLNTNHALSLGISFYLG